MSASPIDPRPTRSRPAPPPPSRSTAGWLAIIVFAFLAGIGIIGAYRARQRLRRAVDRTADRSPELTELHPARGDGPLRPDRRDRARAVRRVQARGRDVRGDPADPARRHDRGRGQDVLGERRLRPDGDRRRRHRLPPRQQPRRLDDHPAARPRPPARRRARPGPGADRRAQAQGDHPVDPRHAASVPRARTASSEIITAYLNQNYYGNQSYGVKAAARVVLRQGARGSDARRGGDPRRRCRSRRRTTTSCATPSRRCDASRTRTSSARPAASHLVVLEPDTRDRPAPGPDPRPDGRRPDADVGRTQSQRRRARAAKRQGGRARPADGAALAAPHFVWAVQRRAGAQAVRRGHADLRRARRRAACASRRRSTSSSRRSPRSGSRSRRSSRTAGNPARFAKALGFDDYEPWMRTSRTRTSATARSSRSTTRPARSSPTSARPSYYATSSRPEFQPQFDVVDAGLPPAGLGVQAVQLRRRHRRPDLDRRRHAHGRRRPTSAAATRRPTPTTSSAGRSASGTPSSSR